MIDVWLAEYFPMPEVFMRCEEPHLSAAWLSVIRRAAISGGNDRKGLGTPNKQTPYLLRKALLASYYLYLVYVVAVKKAWTIGIYSVGFYNL